MATIKTEYLLKLDEKEALLLSKALGSFNDEHPDLLIATSATKNDSDFPKKS